MAALEEKADGARSGSINSHDHNTANIPTTVPVAPEDSPVGEKGSVQEVEPEKVYPGPLKFSLISLSLCLSIYVVTLVKLQYSSNSDRDSDISFFKGRHCACHSCPSDHR